MTENFKFIKDQVLDDESLMVIFVGFFAGIYSYMVDLDIWTKIPPSLAFIYLALKIVGAYYDLKNKKNNNNDQRNSE